MHKTVKRIVLGQSVTAAAVLMLAPARMVYGDSIQSFAVFGNTGVIYNGFSTTLGTIGSNADIDLLGSSTNITSLEALGNFNGSGDFQTVNGAAVANGYFIGGPLSSYGSLDVGGSASIQGNVGFNLNVGGDLTTSAFVQVGSNAMVGGNANIGWSNTVAGTLGVNENVSLGIYSKINNLVHGGTLTDDSTTTINNQSQGTVTVTPRSLTPVVLPAATVFTAGGAPQTLPLFATVTLAPGRYGALTFNGSNTLNLTAGNYYFSSIQSAGEFDTLNFNLSGGAINIFVAGNVDLLAVSETINGQSFQNADPTLASQVFLESLGSITFDDISPANGSTFFGTLFAPDGPITTGVNESFVGSLISGQTVTIGGANITYEPSAFIAGVPAPEPASIALIVGTAPWLMRRRRRTLRT